MNEQLKPCPFCGDAPHAHNYPDIFGGMQIDCVTVNCPASHITSGDSMFDPLISFNAWNTRADLPPTLEAAMQLPEVRALVEALERIAHASDIYGVEANAEDQGAGTLAYAHKSTCNLARAALAPFTEAKP